MGINIDFFLDPELRHINLRKEGDEEFSQLCADLKIAGLAKIGQHGELIQRMLGCSEAEAFRFWFTTSSPDDEADPAFTGIEEIKSWAKFEGHHDLYIAGLSLRPSKLHKFKFRPRGGHRIELEFTASIKAITDHHLSLLSDKLMQEVKCRVEADPDLLDEAEQEAPA